MRLTQEEGGHADICVFPTGENIVLPLGGNTNDRGEKNPYPCLECRVCGNSEPDRTAQVAFRLCALGRVAPCL